MVRPVILVIMDGVGKGDGGSGDAVALANTPNLDWLLSNCPHTFLKAHGTAVGLPSDEDMGNSEVGHNALGCGQIYSQGAKLVNESIANGKIFQSAAWLELIENCKINGTALHFLGLLSDGNVHSNIAHLLACLDRAKEEGIGRVRVHILLDGRDVPATSALDYVDQLEAHLDGLRSDGFDCKIASGGGRMQITMDRYEANWDMVRRGWETHVLGIGKQFPSARKAIETYRREADIIDQDLPAFVIGDENGPVGKIKNGDSLILFNFRGDRAIEISQAFDNKDFQRFDRGGVTDVCFAGMLQYDGDLMLPKRYLVEPPEIKDTLTDLLIKNKIPQYAISETQKYGHVTYFWNGNKSGKTDALLEDFEEIPSDILSFDQKPRMKSDEITEKLIAALDKGRYGFLRCNFPNGDMVGHTGNMGATVAGIEAVDENLGKVLDAAKKADAVLLVTADHGNADQMLEKGKNGQMQARTAHSLNPVPFILCDFETSRCLKSGNFGLSNVAPTIADLLGLTPPPSWNESMIEK